MNVVKNYLYNMMYQIITLIIPLITVPYISKILGKEGVGITAYTNSIVQYFILFGMVGISLYGNKSIACVRDNKEKLNKTFIEIYSLQIITCTISLVLYIAFIFIYDEYFYISLVQGLYILTALIDISWLFMGLEEFKKTVTRNLILKILGVFAIFLFIKSKEDLWWYIAIISIFQFIGQLALWFYIPKMGIKINKLSIKSSKYHFRKSLALFIPQIAIQIYIILNKTMIGAITTIGEVGIYENSDKIVRLSLAIVTSLGTVMLPKISNTFSKGDLEKVNEYIVKSLKFVSMISIPIMFGLIGISDNLVPWFFGDKFIKSIIVIKVISPIIVFIAWSNVLGIQYLIPTGKNKEFTKSVTFGAVINLGINIFIISRLASVGAAISTVIAELSVTIVQLVMIHKYIKFESIIKDVVIYTVSGLIMMLVVIYIGNRLLISPITTFIQILTGTITYGTLILSFYFNDVKLLLKIVRR